MNVLLSSSWYWWTRTTRGIRIGMNGTCNLINRNRTWKLFFHRPRRRMSLPTSSRPLASAEVERIRMGKSKGGGASIWMIRTTESGVIMTLPPQEGEEYLCVYGYYYVRRDSSCAAASRSSSAILENDIICVAHPPLGVIESFALCESQIWTEFYILLKFMWNRDLFLFGLQSHKKWMGYWTVRKWLVAEYLLVVMWEHGWQSTHGWTDVRCDYLRCGIQIHIYYITCAAELYVHIPYQKLKLIFPSSSSCNESFGGEWRAAAFRKGARFIVSWLSLNLNYNLKDSW